MSRIFGQQDACWRQVRDRVQLRDPLSAIGSFSLQGATPAGDGKTIVQNYMGLCIPVRFSNVTETTSIEQIKCFLNSPDESVFGNNGSVYSYFRDNSLGQCCYKNHVTEWYTAKHPFEYYDDPTMKFGERSAELMREVLEWLHEEQFDFSRLTYSDCLTAHSITILYAGDSYNKAPAGLWSHQDELPSCVRLGDSGLAKKFAVIGTGNENSGHGLLPLGTFCHEIGHLLFSFPDLYDLDKEPVNQAHGVGNYCLMGNGGTSTAALARDPVNLCAYLKLYAGWQQKMTDLATGPGQHVAVAEQNQVFYFSKNDSEYFLIENRQQSGRDAGLPCSGLAIWHIDHNGSNRYEQRADYHFECALEQADGRFDLEQTEGAGNGGDAEDLFPTDHWASFGHITTPNSRWWDGTRSGLEITNITRKGTNVEFEIRQAGDNKEKT